MVRKKLRKLQWRKNKLEKILKKSLEKSKEKRDDPPLKSFLRKIYFNNLAKELDIEEQNTNGNIKTC